MRPAAGCLFFSQHGHFGRDMQGSETMGLSQKMQAISHGIFPAAKRPSSWCHGLHQVRCMAAVLLLIGSKLEEAEVITELLRSRCWEGLWVSTLWPVTVPHVKSQRLGVNSYNFNNKQKVGIH